MNLFLSHYHMFLIVDVTSSFGFNFSIRQLAHIDRGVGVTCVYLDLMSTVSRIETDLIQEDATGVTFRLILSITEHLATG